MIAVCKDQKRRTIPHRVCEEKGRWTVSVDKNQDFSNIEVLELDGFEEIAGIEDEGYVLIPRAVGSDDYGLCRFQKHPEAFETTLKELNMPVFGLKTKERCFLAVASDMTWNFCLRILQKDGRFSLYPGFIVEGESPEEDFQIEFFELMGEDANYSGMARKYRSYRMEKGELIPLAERMKENACLGYSVNSAMIRIRCGWKPAPPEVKHQTLENEPKMHVACDFDRVGDLLNELKAQGVDAAEICLVGWNVKGHDGRWPQAFPVAEELGGEEKLRRLIRKAQQIGYQITCHTNSTDQYEIADCYSQDNTRRDKALEPVSNAFWSGGQMYELCPRMGYEQAQEMLPAVAQLGFKGSHYIDVIGVIYPRKCYHEEHPVSYKQSVEYAKKICAIARKEFGGISSEGAYDYLAPDLDYGLYISFKQGGEGLCDKPVPFWQIVYHGTVLSNPYAMTVNPTFKEPESLLKMVEYGGRPTYYFYSAFMGNGKNWMGSTDARCDDDAELKESVAKVKKGYDVYRALAPLHTVYMDKHEEISEDVYESTYSNGTVVRVNYKEKKYEVIEA